MFVQVADMDPAKQGNPKMASFNRLKAELNPICHLLALLGGATTVVVSRPIIPCFA